MITLTFQTAEVEAIVRSLATTDPTSLFTGDLRKRIIDDTNRFLEEESKKKPSDSVKEEIKKWK